MGQKFNNSCQVDDDTSSYLSPVRWLVQHVYACGFFAVRHTLFFSTFQQRWQVAVALSHPLCVFLFKRTLRNVERKTERVRYGLIRTAVEKWNMSMTPAPQFRPSSTIKRKQSTETYLRWTQMYPARNIHRWAVCTSSCSKPVQASAIAMAWSSGDGPGNCGIRVSFLLLPWQK